MDTYTDFKDLKAHEAEGRDYRITVRRGDPRVAVVAIHGGRIEPGTAHIANEVAGDDYALYCFKGIKPSGNRALHLTAKHFDEPKGKAAAEMAGTVIAIHGCRGAAPFVTIGGKDSDLRKRIKEALTRAGFRVRESCRPGLRGIHPDNICNRGLSGRGVQIEISEGLRRELFDALIVRARRQPTERHGRFVDALRKVLDARFFPDRCPEKRPDPQFSTTRHLGEGLSTP